MLISYVTMNGLVLLSLCLVIFGAATARMPQELRDMFKFSQAENTQPGSNLREDLKEEPGTLVGSEFDFSKFLAQSSPSAVESIETARRKLGAGDVNQYMPAPIKNIQCHVEFQVTERVPGRCTRLAGSIPACQAEKYIGINYNECS